MEEGTVASWLKKVGDKVEEGDILAEIETDKATMEFESFNEGYLLHIGIEEGQTAAVDTLLAIIGDQGEDISSLLSGSSEIPEPTEEVAPTSDVSDSNLPAQASESSIPEGVIIVNMPRLSDTMEEGTVLAWSKISGEEYDRGDILLELETDKMVVEVPALEDGKILEILADEGAVVAIGEPIARVEVESSEEVAEADSVPETSPQSTPTRQEQPSTTTPSPSQEVDEEEDLDLGGLFIKSSEVPERIRASPAARRIASKSGLSLNEIKGTGPLGRISGDDVRRSISRGVSDPVVTKPEINEIEPTINETVLESDALNISYLRKGPSGKTPLVFLHGFGADLNSWRFNVSLLAKTREVWSLDLPGHGASWDDSMASPGFNPGVEDLAENIAQFLMLAGIDRAHLFGHSMGGGIALSLASAHPERVASLGLLAPLGLGPEINHEFIRSFSTARDREKLVSALHRLFYHGSWVNAALVGPLEEQRKDPKRLQALSQITGGLLQENRQRWQGRKMLEKLNMPVKVIWGRDDLVIPSDQVLGLPGTVGLHLFPETGHMPHVEQAMGVNRLIEELCAFE